MQPVALEQGWKYPSYIQVCRLMQALPPDMKTMLVENSRQYFEEWSIISRKEQKYVNELWQMDATQLDLWVLDPVNGEVFRPWMTSIIDGYSRVIMAVWLHRNTPNTEETLLGLRKAILPKSKESYPFFGIPQGIQTDNGKIYRSADYYDSLLRLNIQSVEIPPQVPCQNGKIERWQGVMKQGLLRNLEGYSGQHNALAKAQKSCIPFPLLEGLIEKYLLKYHLSAHSELEKSPWEAFHEGLSNAHGLNIDVKEVIEAIKVRRDVVVQRDGIEICGRRLHSSKLCGLVGETITLRISPDLNLDKVEAYHKGDSLGFLKDMQEPTLAAEIKSARLNRSSELQKLRRSLQEAAERIIPKSSDSGKPSNKEKPQDVSSEKEIKEIPKLETDEEDI